MSKIQTIRRIPKVLMNLLQVITVSQLNNAIRSTSTSRIASFNNLPKDFNVVVLAPHPDDEIFGCAGMISRHIKAGNSVTVVYLAQGDKGTSSGRKDTSLIELRQKEALTGLKELGGARAVFLHLPDGELSPNKWVINKIKEILSDNIDRVYVPWFGEENQDHLAVFKIFMAASIELPKLEVFLYEVWTPLVPNFIIPLEDNGELKRRAIRSHKSQFTSRQYEEGIMGLNYYRAMTANSSSPCEAYYGCLRKNLDFYQKLFGL